LRIEEKQECQSYKKVTRYIVYSLEDNLNRYIGYTTYLQKLIITRPCESYELNWQLIHIKKNDGENDKFMLASHLDRTKIISITALSNQI